MGENRNYWQWAISFYLVNLAAILEKADEGLLPAVYSEISTAFHASPSELGWLTFIRALVQALCSPIAGLLATKYNRTQVIGWGTMLWAASTAGVGMSTSYFQCAVWRAFTGVGLAIVIPAVQSFVADNSSEDGRGFAFGLLNFIGSAGSIAGSMSATILAGSPSILGIPGWRFAFLGMAVLSIFVGWMVTTFAVDPRSLSQNTRIIGKTGQVIANSSETKETWAMIKSVLGIKTFQIIVLQGLVGSIPWQAMVFFTMWLQLVGFSHRETAFLTGIFSVGCAFGALFGGWLGDRSVKKFPYSGRIMCAQLSSFLGVPFSFVLFIALPQNSTWWPVYAITFFLGGLTISWCQACTNNPLFAEIVPSDLRTTVYAFDRAFEGAIAALAAPAVGLFAETLFGFKSSSAIPEGGSLTEAKALSKGLFLCMAPSFFLCSLCYGLLYFTYSKDRKRVLARES